MYFLNNKTLNFQRLPNPWAIEWVLYSRHKNDINFLVCLYQSSWVTTWIVGEGNGPCLTLPGSHCWFKASQRNLTRHTAFHWPCCLFCVTLGPGLQGAVISPLSSLFLAFPRYCSHTLSESFDMVSPRSLCSLVSCNNSFWILAFSMFFFLSFLFIYSLLVIFSEMTPKLSGLHLYQRDLCQRDFM